MEDTQVAQTEPGIGTTDSTNNANPEQVTETGQQTTDVIQKGTEQKTETGGTSAEIAKPEFQDPNMQKRFTERMQEISRKEAELGGKLTKAQAFERILQDKDVVEFLQRKYVQRQPEEPVIPELTEEQFLEATTNPVKFRETVMNMATNIARAIVQKEVAPYAEKLNKLEVSEATKALEQDIDDFANTKDGKGNVLYPDFWTYSTEIQQYLEKFRNVPLSNSEKLDTAYRLAKYPFLQKETIAKAHNIIAGKKAASTEKGGSTNVQKTNKNLSLDEVIEETAASLKW